MTKEEFKAWRKSMGYSQSTAAQALGLSRSAIEQYETGFRKAEPNKPSIIPLTTALACSALSASLKPWGKE